MSSNRFFLCTFCILVIFALQIYGFTSKIKVKSLYQYKFSHQNPKTLSMTSLQPIDNLLSNLPNSFAVSESIPQYDSVFHDLSLLMAEDEGYSKLSLYFTLALYLVSLPGLFSLVKRSVQVTPVIKTYDIPGPANPTSKPLRQTAAEIMAYFKALNYEPEITPEVISFKGVMGRSNSQAAFLTFCTLVALASAGLVISILFPNIGNFAYLITLLSPYAGIYYWNNAQRVDEVQVKIETSDDEQTTSIITRGGKEDLERFSTTLKLPERGKVYVKGIFDGGNVDQSIASKVSTLSAELQAKVESQSDATPKNEIDADVKASN